MAAIKIDEQFLVEWFEFGWDELCAYLANYAAFWRWCQEHHR